MDYRKCIWNIIFTPFSCSCLTYKWQSSVLKIYKVSGMHRVYGSTNIQHNALKHGEFSPKSSQKTPHNSPMRVRYGVSFVDITSDAYFISVMVLPYVKSCYDGLHYESTRLYLYTYTLYTFKNVRVCCDLVCCDYILLAPDGLCHLFASIYCKFIQ